MSLLRRGLGRVMGGRSRGNFTGSLAGAAMQKASSAVSQMFRHGKNAVKYDPETSLGTQAQSKYTTGERYE